MKDIKSSDSHHQLSTAPNTHAHTEKDKDRSNSSSSKDLPEAGREVQDVQVHVNAAQRSSPGRTLGEGPSCRVHPRREPHLGPLKCVKKINVG